MQITNPAKKPVFKNRPNEMVTTTDGRKIWVSRSVAVVGIITCYSRNQRYFAIEKRGTAINLDKQGLWCLPCGYLDWDESGPDAIRREAWEEIGLNLEELCPWIEDFQQLQPWFVKTAVSENRQNVTLRYAFDISNPSDLMAPLPQLYPNNDCEPNEVADAFWVTEPDLKYYEFAFNHDKVIRQYIAMEQEKGV